MTPRSAAALALLVAAGAVAACGGVGAATRDENTLLLWETYNPQEHEVFVGIVRDFEAWYRTEHPDRPPARIDVKVIPFDQHMEKINFAAITGTAPDIARIDAGQLVDLAYGQAIVDISGIDPEVDSYLSTFMLPARESVKVPVPQPDGSVRTGTYGIPDQITGVAIYYNKEMLRRAGLPTPPASLAEMEAANPRWDWARFRQYARALTDSPAQYGIGLYQNLWWAFPWFNSYGADFVRVDSGGKIRCVLNSDSGVAALTEMVSLYWDGTEAGAWLPGAVGADMGFANGKYAMHVSGPWNLQSFPNVDFGVALIPEGPARREIPVPALGRSFTVGTSTNVGGTDMVILKSCRNPALAYEFLRYLTSPVPHAKWCNTLGQIPVNQTAETLVNFEANPALKVFVDQMRTAIARPKIPRYGVLDGQIMSPQIDRAYRSRSSEEVRRALDSAVRDIEEKILAEVNAR